MKKKLLMTILFLTTVLGPEAKSASEPKIPVSCPKPAQNAATAFSIIQNPSGRSLKKFLEENVVSRTALNEKCENMYLAAIRSRNELARTYLDSIGFGPKNALEVNTAQIYAFMDPLNYFEYSITYGTVAAYEHLRALGGSLSETNIKNGVTALILASFGNTESFVEHFIREGIDVTAKSVRGNDALLYAAVGNPRVEVINLLLARGGDITTVNNLGLNALMFAAAYNSKAVVETLIRAGADINSTDIQGGWPLLYAAAKNPHVEVLTTLIRAGADINAFDKNGKSVLMYAASYNRVDIVEALLKAGAQINRMNKDFQNALMFACFRTNSKLVETLLRAGADINSQDFDGWSPLMIAAYSSSMEVIETLIKSGANKNAKNKEGYTAYEIAKKRKRDAGILKLLEY